MKKLIVTTLASTCVAVGAFAQGSVSQIENLFSTDGVTIPGLNATDPISADPSLYFSGNVSITLYYASAANVSGSEISAINALDGVSGLAAVSLLGTDGFSLASATSLTGSTAGAVLGYTISSGGVTAGPATIGLLAPVPTGGSGWLALVITEIGGANNGALGVLAFNQANLGGNPTTLPTPGIPENIVVDPAGLNLVLTPVPEPTTLALAAIGGAAMLFIRRKK